MKTAIKPFTTEDTGSKPIARFATAEEAWFWFMRSEKARTEGAKTDRWNTLSERPCDPDDIFRWVSRLYYEGIMVANHLLVMGEYGYLDRFPDRARDDEITDFVIWVDAFDTLEPYLRERGVVE